MFLCIYVCIWAPLMFLCKYRVKSTTYLPSHTQRRISFEHRHVILKIWPKSYFREWHLISIQRNFDTPPKKLRYFSARYSWVYNFFVFRSLWYKNTVCRMYQVRKYHTPAILRYATHTREPWPKLADFDTRYLIHFLAKYLIWETEIHRECLLRPPIKLVSHRWPEVAVFYEGCLKLA
jgi:hypothetical protein